MKTDEIYLDFAAATPLDEAVATAMAEASNIFANPSAQYTAGRIAHDTLKKARADVAHILAAKSQEIVFTSGATEANNLAIIGSLRAVGMDDCRVLTIATEHKAVLEPLQNCGAQIDYAHIDERGMVDLADIKQKISDNTVLVTISYASSEIGSIQPIGKIAQLIRDVREDRAKRLVNVPIYFQCDASAAAGHLSLDVNRLGVDLMSLNAAKVYGPKGSGVLYVRRATSIKPIIYGGGQEFALRPGTENIAGAVAIAAALKKAEQLRESETKRLGVLSSYLQEKLSSLNPRPTLNGHPKKKLAGHVSMSFDGINGEDLVAYLDAAGIAVGTGAACAAADSEPSKAVMSLGRTREAAQGTLRVSMGRTTTQEQLDRFMDELQKSLVVLATMKS